MSTPELKAWVNGRMSRARMITDDHNVSANFGWKPFEGIRGYKTPEGIAIFRLEAHIERLLNSARLLNIPVPYDKVTLMRATCETVAADGGGDVYIRPSISYTERKSCPFSTPQESTDTVIRVEPWNETMKESVHVIISRFKRLNKEQTYPEAKFSGNYGPSQFATIEAKNRGADDAILLDLRGYVAEGCWANIFCVKNKILLTPKLGSILPGITRMTLTTLARSLGYQVEERDISLHELISWSQEAFFCGTATEVQPIISIEDEHRHTYVIGDGEPGPITLKLKELYTRIVHAQVQAHLHWCTIVCIL